MGCELNSCKLNGGLVHALRTQGRSQAEDLHRVSLDLGEIVLFGRDVHGATTTLMLMFIELCPAGDHDILQV